MINSRASVGVLVALLCGAATLVAAQTGPGVRVERLLDSPIITPSLHPSIGENIQGPSLIRVPDWVENRLGTYYLYFADHKGRYIRLAYADDLMASKAWGGRLPVLLPLLTAFVFRHGPRFWVGRI